MKATIDIPDDLYRMVKARSALEGRPIRAVAIELFQRWLDEATPWTDGSSEPDSAARGRAHTPEEWLETWLQLGAELSRNAPPGPTATEILEADRNRLERS
jgi:hypothetical protein